MNRRRLDFEALRDSAVGGGRPARSGRWADRARTCRTPAAQRRTIYGRIDRQGLPGMLPTFDFASPDTHSPERYSTTVPQQALFLMNGPLAIEMARAFAGRDDVKQSRRSRRSVPADDANRVGAGAERRGDSPGA